MKEYNNKNNKLLKLLSLANSWSIFPFSELLSGTESYDPMTLSEIVPSALPVETLAEAHTESGHSRNSSNTSQLSKGSGYGSLNSHSQHSRQSSSGDSGHIR